MLCTVHTPPSTPTPNCLKEKFPIAPTCKPLYMKCAFFKAENRKIKYKNACIAINLPPVELQESEDDDHSEDEHDVLYDECDGRDAAIIFECAQQWERTSNKYGRQFDKLHVRSKSHHKKEKVTRFFVNARTQRLDEERKARISEYLQAEKENRAIARAKVESLLSRNAGRMCTLNCENTLIDMILRKYGVYIDPNVPRQVLLQELFLQLETRELMPDDYDLLLLLDETVPKKTLQNNDLKKKGFKKRVLCSEDVGIVGECCVICMDDMAVGDEVRTLSCKHTFHTSCIDRWLTSSSDRCPTDGLSV
eukprot:Colp12_sorted_trinity150504_noHs@20685